MPAPMPNNDLTLFRQHVRTWLTVHCPATMRQTANPFELSYGGRNPEFFNDDAKHWMQIMAAKGWTAPQWPKAYGGAELSSEEAGILEQEMHQLGCRPALTGHGLWMLGPALLTFGSEMQKQQFLPDIVHGRIRWCQGYSEPNAGSDLANIQCKAEDMGEHYVVNGTKIWTTDADKADWIFCLVRTNTAVKKQAGISFLLIDMRSPGIDVKPISLINGENHFCQTFFDNVQVPKTNRVGEENQGWGIAKQLLLHERKMMSDLQALMPKPSYTLHSIANDYLQNNIPAAEKALCRHRISEWQINNTALALTKQRICEEEQKGESSGAAFIMKYYGTEQDVIASELASDIASLDAMQWDPKSNSLQQKIANQFLHDKVLLLGGGSSEIQLNIIAKNILGLPDVPKSRKA